MKREGPGTGGRRLVRRHPGLVSPLERVWQMRPDSLSACIAPYDFVAGD